MSGAYRCDRCYAYDEGKPVLHVITKTTDPPVRERSFDLCPPCLSALNEWLDAHKDGRE